MVHQSPAQRSPANRSVESKRADQNQPTKKQARNCQAPTSAISVQASAPLQRLQGFANASPRLAQLQRLRTLAAGATQGLSQRQSPNPHNSLPEGLQRGIEILSGLTMDHVRVHYDSPMPAQFHALAYAQGSNIHLGPGQDKHLPHEAWHLVQQAQGRVRPTLQVNGNVPVNDDPQLEREADQLGARALRIGGR